MNSRIERILIALLFALLAAGITLVVASAQYQAPPPAQTSSDDCATCHAEFQTTWQSGAHGQAAIDPIFLNAWTEQGKPSACLTCHVTGYDSTTATWKADGVTCEACHGVAPNDHPKTPMPVNLSTELCGKCHNDTRFGWQGYEASTHYQQGMDCATCHDPHSTALKKMPGKFGEAGMDATSELCINCHKETDEKFATSSHHQQNVSCADCHINQMKVDERAPHTVPDHSFAPNIETCNKCHADEMHASGNTDSTIQSSSHDIKTASLAPEPDPVSPIGFSAMAALIGLTGGMVLAPWLERWYRKATKETASASSGDWSSQDNTETNNDETNH
jgi:predicted CXXCH cytochrome family protein